MATIATKRRPTLRTALTAAWLRATIRRLEAERDRLEQRIAYWQAVLDRMEHGS